MEKRIEMGMLLAFYGGLLTERQRRVLEAYYSEDYSLSEIAQELGITRQGVHDAIARGEAVLLRAEEHAGLMSRYQIFCDGMQVLRQHLLQEGDAEGLEMVEQIRQIWEKD